MMTITKKRYYELLDKEKMLKIFYKAYPISEESLKKIENASIEIAYNEILKERQRKVI